MNARGARRATGDSSGAAAMGGAPGERQRSSPGLTTRAGRLHRAADANHDGRLTGARVTPETTRATAAGPDTDGVTTGTPSRCGCDCEAATVCDRHCDGCAGPEPTAREHTGDCLAGARSLLASRAAAARVTFQLTYARSPVRRRFAAGLLTGPDLSCAYGSDVRASGDWEDSQDASGASPHRDADSWIDQYATYAVNEGIHEVLEWLRVDGRPWLDPHGEAEEDIYALANDFCAQLAALRRTHIPSRGAGTRAVTAVEATSGHGEPAEPAPLSAAQRAEQSPR